MFVIPIVISILIAFVLTSDFGTNAYCSYHLYTASDSLTSVACSDGVNGLITKLHYKDLSPLFPYVTAWDQVRWNSPNCGTCIEVTNKNNRNKKVYLTVIDQCGGNMGRNSDTHFDISREAYYELFGDKGIIDGVSMAEWRVVNTNQCKGNRRMNFLEYVNQIMN